MKVQFLKDHDGDYTFGTEYLEGDVITLPDHNAKALIEAGACVEVKEEPVAEPPKPKAVWKEPAKK
jgi:hypothetical protein